MGQLLGEKLGLRVFERWCRQVTEKEKTGKNEARIAFQRFQHVFLDWFRPNDWSPLMKKKLREKLSTDKYVRLETGGSMGWSDIRSKAMQEVRDEEFELFLKATSLGIKDALKALARFLTFKTTKTLQRSWNAFLAHHILRNGPQS